MKAATETTPGRSALVLIGGRMAGGAVGLALIALLTRELTLREFGLYTYALALLNLLRVLVGFGGNDVATAELAQAPERRREILGSLLSLRVQGALLCTALYVAVVVASEGEERDALLLAAPFLLFSAGKALDPALQVAQRFDVIAVVRFLAQAAVLATLFVCARVGALSLGVAVAVAAAGPALAQAVLVARALRSVRPVWSWSPRPGLAFLARSWPQALATVCGLVTFHVDTLMLRHLEGPLETAVYGAAYRVFAFSVAIPTLFAAPLLPELARDPVARPRLLRRSLVTALAGGLAAAGIMALAAPFVLDLLADEAPYAASTTVLRLLFVALVGFGVTSVCGVALVAAGRQRSWAVVCALALALNLALDVVWIPRFGALGAASATLVTELAGALLAVALVRGLLAAGAPLPSEGDRAPRP